MTSRYRLRHRLSRATFPSFPSSDTSNRPIRHGAVWPWRTIVDTTEQSQGSGAATTYDRCSPQNAETKGSTGFPPLLRTSEIQVHSSRGTTRTVFAASSSVIQAPQCIPRISCGTKIFVTSSRTSPRSVEKIGNQRIVGCTPARDRYSCAVGQIVRSEPIGLQFHSLMAGNRLV